MRLQDLWEIWEANIEVVIYTYNETSGDYDEIFEGNLLDIGRDNSILNRWVEGIYSAASNRGHSLEISVL